MNKLPIMPIRVKYAEKSASGKDLDSAVIADADGKVSVTSITAEEIKGGDITGDSIIENMTGYSASKSSSTESFVDVKYAGVVKNGNKITFALAMKITPTQAFKSAGGDNILNFSIPHDIFTQIYPLVEGTQVVSLKPIALYANISQIVNCVTRTSKSAYSDTINVLLTSVSGLTVDTPYYLRYEETYLLSESLL